jgi:hypothetical protein
MEDILISQPGELDNVATNILFIQQNKAMGLIFAKNAKNTANEFFNADKYVDELINFISKQSPKTHNRQLTEMF